MTQNRNLSILADGLSSSGVVSATYGGTGQSSYTTGDTLYASSSTVVSKLGIGSSGQVLTVVSGLPAWASPSAAALVAGTTTISSGNTTRMIYDSSGVFTETTAGITTDGTKLTLAGSTSSLAEVITNAAEVATISATAATGTINYDVTTQSVLYYTSNASANWTVNFRASSGTSLNTAMSTGQSVTVAFLVTQGGTAYYNSAVQVDGNSVTPKWQGGTAPSAGDASSVDAYVYTIVKVGSASFTIFASLTKFA